MAFTMRVAVAVIGLARAAQSRIGFARSPCAAAHVNCQRFQTKPAADLTVYPETIPSVCCISLLMSLSHDADSGHVSRAGGP